jgi:hypothetical protein
LADSNPEELSRVKVLVRFISLENSPPTLGQRITIATNTQNRVEKKDFVSLESEQARIKHELKMEGIEYHYKRTEERITANDTNYLLEEVAFSLASLWSNVDYSTMVKKESGKLWDDITNPPYIDLFNSQTSAQKIIKATRIYRYVSQIMNEWAWNRDGREKSVYRYGNSFVTHLICHKMSKELWADTNTGFEKFYQDELPKLTSDYAQKLWRAIEAQYSDTMIVYTLRNYTKCRNLKEVILSS